MAQNEDGLFPVLSSILKASSTPLDCNQLYDLPEVKEHAASPNRVSDYLGNLWRKGFVVRHVQARTESSRARFSYEWKDKKSKVGAGAKASTAKEGIEYAPRVLADRPSMVITEEGNTVSIELPNLIIVIKQKT
ncbi:MAG: hypothetical protein JSS14_22250 [Proteobacteria bacterium]|nr:hypothetical protein [Pseudomonadota bacterium]